MSSSMIRSLPAAAILALLAGCGEASPPPPVNVLPPDAAPKAALPPAPAPALANVAGPADPELAELSPRQRRAYEKGLADCRAGRYEPDPWPEAYRIGCAAAHDR